MVKSIMPNTPPPSPASLTVRPLLTALIIPNNRAETGITEWVTLPFQTAFGFFPLTNPNVPEEPDLPGDPEHGSAFFQMEHF